MFPRQFDVRTIPPGESRTLVRLLELDYKIGPCACGVRMNDFRVRARITEFFNESEAGAIANGDIKHEDQHVRAHRRKIEEIAGGARVIYMKCVSPACFNAWINWWETVKSHANAVSVLENARIDFDDPEYDPASKPTKAQIAEDEAAATAARAAMEAAQTIKAALCGF
jgi:hypothetical protein